MHPLDKLFNTRQKEILNIYFTAGYPNPESTGDILRLLEQHGADIVEVGLPFSDPLADGPVIQHSSMVALQQGITIDKILEQLSQVNISIPIVLMGYLNPVLQYGFERFLRNAARAGASAVILPDLPAEVFRAKYQAMYETYGLYPVFLVSPQTSDERIRMLDSLSRGFLYAVSTSSTTGKDKQFGDFEAAWFRRLNGLKLNNPVLAGFGISDNRSLRFVFDHLPGAVVGSALIRHLDASKSDYGIPSFMKHLLNPES
ncbi:MAG: tryptophan synthase subunit alpha [Bacteroidetes bacterium]|nr:tryptophan synthase subunit alpha [Bacteroidota bacterium]